MGLRTPLRLSQLCKHQSRLLRFYSTEPSAPPLLLKLRTDLKTAMRSKDISRLNVLRDILSSVTNASKTSSPVKNDLQVLALLRKRAAASRAAGEEFKSAKREDLAEKEEGQVKVLEEYAGRVDVLGEKEVRRLVKGVEGRLRGKGKVEKGVLLRALMGAGGAFEGKAVERVMVVRIVQEVLEEER